MKDALDTTEQLGEISAGRQASESGKVAPGNMATLRALTDPDRRPSLPANPSQKPFSP